jgi:hypothetical protein
MRVSMVGLFQAIWLLENSILPVSARALGRFINIVPRSSVKLKDRIAAMKDANDPIYCGIVQAIANAEAERAAGRDALVVEK